MSPSIYEDALARPELFPWFGVIDSDLNIWLRTLPFRVHPGLVSFWRRTGGGDLFESETILGPLAPDESENVLKVNEFHWGRGMPRDLVLFHVGSFHSASYVDWRRHKNLLVTLKPDSHEIEERFGTFGAWYEGTIRAEFRERYGL